MGNWKIKFAVIWSGQAVSIFTSAVLQMALIWHLAIETESALILSLASIAGFLPMAVLGTFAGALVDRWNRKLAMIGADLFIAAVSLGLVVFTLFAEPPLWFILMVLFLRSTGTAFHSPAISAVTPLIVPEAYLAKCAGYTQSLQTLGFIVGTSVAAILYPIWGITGMVALDVAGAVIASVTVAAVSIPSLPKTEQEKRQNLITEIKDAFGIFKTHKGLFAFLWIGAAFTFFFAPVNALFPLMSMGHFGGTTSQAAIAEITFASGMMIGGLILGIWGGFKNRGVTLFASIALLGAAIGISGLLPAGGFIIFAGLSLLMGFSAPFFNGTQIALMQEKISPEYLGRVFGLYGSVLSGTMLLGLIVSGLSADAFGVNTWFFISGAVILLISIVTILMPSIRNIDK